jgi:hypothetical protein
MSQIPSNSLQFNAGMEAAQGNIALMGQNQRTKIDQDMQLRQLALQGQRMQQEERMQMRGLAAEAANYRDLNRSRAEMQREELGQQQRQFEQNQAYLREQAQAERLIQIELQKLQAQREAVNARLAAGADQDTAGLRNERNTINQNMVRLQEMMSSAQHGLARAQGLKDDRMEEIRTRAVAFGDTIASRRGMAQEAIGNGVSAAVLKDALDGGFVNDVARRFYEDSGGTTAGVVGEGIRMMTGTGAYQKILAENLMESVFGYSDPESMRKRMTDLQKSPQAFAGAIVHNAFSQHGDAFGLDAGKKAEAAVVATRMIGDAGILADLDPKVRAGGGDVVEGQYKKIAEGFKKLRDMGMGDEQITAILDGLEGIGSGSSELLMQFGLDQKGAGMQRVLMDTTEGVGQIGDLLRHVAESEKYMAPVGGVLTDLSKFDIKGLMRKADLAYGVSSSPEIEALMRDLEGMGMTDQDVQQMMGLLSVGDDMRPEEIQAALQAMARESKMGELRAKEVDQEMGRSGAQFVARGQAQAAEEELKALDALARRFGG